MNSLKFQKNKRLNLLLSDEIDQIYNVIKLLNDGRDIYIECNSLVIIIPIYFDENIKTLDRYYADGKKLNEEEIKDLIIDLNNNINIIKYSYKNLGNINSGNILISNKGYKFLFLFDYLIHGYKYEIRNNRSLRTDLQDIGDLIEKLFGEIKVIDENKEYNFDLLGYDINIQSKKRQSCFLSIIIEKIKKQISWDNYCIECIYNILDKPEKRSIAYLPEFGCTAFFCKINCDKLPIEKVLITKYLGNISESLKIRYLKDNSQTTMTLNLRSRKVKNFSYEEFTCIELLDEDKIENFFVMDENYFKGNHDYENIILFQALDKPSFKEELYCSVGEIKEMKVKTLNSFYFDAESIGGANGAPIVLSKKSNYLIGMNIRKPQNSEYKKAMSINLILSTLIKSYTPGCIFS